MTKVKVVLGTIVVLVVAAFAFQAYESNTGTRRQGSEEVHLVVDFDVRKSHPDIMYQVSSGPAQHSTAGNRSPWDKFVWANKGDLILLQVTQKGPGESKCWIIHRSNLVAPNNPIYLPGPGTVTCQYVVT